MAEDDDKRFKAAAVVTALKALKTQVAFLRALAFSYEEIEKELHLLPDTARTLTIEAAEKLGVVKTLSPFDKLDRAYKEGKKAAKAGLPRSANPYPRTGTLKRKMAESWGRGWIAVSNLEGIEDRKRE